MDKDNPCKIPLRNSNKEIIDYAYVSPEDYDNVNKYKWHLYSKLNEKTNYENKYAAGYISLDNKTMRLHHFILGKPEKGYVIDHKDGNGLNNTRENLRFATHAQNAQNKQNTKTEISHSKYLGVTQVECNKKWRTGAANIYLGTFDTEIEAAIMYDKYTYLKFGPDARTNNLITYDEVKDLDLEELLKNAKNARSERELPSSNQISYLFYSLNGLEQASHLFSRSLYALLNHIMNYLRTREKFK